MKNILITGGPVHCHIDAVKIITNNFKGGRMVQLSEELLEGSWEKDEESEGYTAKIIYLCPRGVAEPKRSGITVLYHDGYADYRDKILDLAPDMDAIIFGAAVANLIPEKPWAGKFPSHNFQEGETIHIPFIVAPRIINMVKEVAKPSCHLFGFKLLKGVAHEELIDAAYEIVIAAKTTCVFANDRNDLDTKYAVTKERGVHKMGAEDVSKFILECMNDEYYSTKTFDFDFSGDTADTAEVGLALVKAKALVEKNKDRFKKVGEYVFGTVAHRIEGGSFITTARGKNETHDFSFVKSVDHHERVVNSCKKASLNAPLLHDILINNPDVYAIVHTHELNSGLPVLPYAPPGTARDSIRHITDSFEIEGHGTFELLR